jgi:hypothetical protein
MQTLVPIGTFEGKALRLLGKASFDDMLEFLARQRQERGDSSDLLLSQRGQADVAAADLREGRSGKYDDRAKGAIKKTR